MAGNGRWALPRSVRTALDRSSHLGWAEMRHPFHPLRGQQFEVFKQRRRAGVDTLIVREPEFGSINIAQQPDPASQTHRSTTSNAYGAMCLNVVLANGTALHGAQNHDEHCRNAQFKGSVNSTNTQIANESAKTRRILTSS